MKIKNFFGSKEFFGICVILLNQLFPFSKISFSHSFLDQKNKIFLKEKNRKESNFENSPK